MDVARRQVLLGALVAGVLGLGLLVSPAAVLSQVRTVLWSPWFPVVLLGLYAVRSLLAWPVTALSVLVGYRYGIELGVPVALAGAVLTSLPPYAVARYVRTDAGWLGRATTGSERFFAATGDLRGTVAARLAPTPAEVISVAAGAGRVSVGAFALGTALGEIPWTIAAVFAGASMRRLSPSGVETVDPALLAGGLLAAGVLLAEPAYRFLRDRSDTATGGA
ncbi:MAG: TVP38/TMEM64 family protein [Halanaeroarchaeum sp.]